MTRIARWVWTVLAWIAATTTRAVLYCTGDEDAEE